jgi:hypothetical protein
MTGHYRRPVLRVWIDGREVTNRFSARAKYGLDLRVAEAEIVAPVMPAWASVYNPTTGRGSLVTIVMGPNPSQAYHRFQGFLVSERRSLEPPGVALACRGLLERARSYQQSAEDGVDMSNDGNGATDGAQVGAALDACGLTAEAVGELGGGRAAVMGGTSALLGTTSDDFVWREKQSGLSYIESLDEISVGASGIYRTFETFGGTIVRVPISTIPTSTPVFTFREGVDIFTAEAETSGMERKNRCVVTGYGPTPETAAYAVTEEAGAAAYITDPFASNKIEKDLDSDPGDGISAKAVANYRYAERNRNLVRLNWSTHRGEMLGPAQTVRVEGAGGTEGRVGLAQNLWLQHVECGVVNGEWTQWGTALAGKGEAPASDLPPMADFSMTCDRELIVSGSSEVPLYTVHCTPAALGLSGTIAAYSWTATSGTPASGTGSTFTTSYLDPASKSITLQVTDSNALTATVTKPVPPATATQWTRRPLYAAAKTQAQAFTGASWATDAQDAAADVLVCSNGPVWGAGDKVMYSADFLATSAGEATVKTGVNVTALYVETDISANKILAGLADGSVAINLDGGA